MDVEQFGLTDKEWWNLQLLIVNLCITMPVLAFRLNVVAAKKKLSAEELHILSETLIWGWVEISISNPKELLDF